MIPEYRRKENWRKRKKEEQEKIRGWEAREESGEKEMRKEEK